MSSDLSEDFLNPNDRYEFDQGIDEEDSLSEEHIEKPYDPTKIQVDPHSMTVFQVMRKIKLGEINLQPDFQRHVVWDPIRQSRLIESMLIRIPLPAFYMDARNDNEWLVVDGLQRLWTLDHFYNKKDIRLHGLEFLDQLEGKNYDELPRSFQRQIEETELSLHVIKPDTPPEAKFAIFYRINTGGMVLTAQEIRHCLFQGKSTELLKKLAASKEFLDATTGSINTKRMDDRECVIRFCAFHIQPFTNYKESDLNKFLSNAMRSINEMREEEIENLERSFIKAMVLSRGVFGRHAFRKMFETDGYRYPINKSIFEVWSVSLEKFDEALLLARRDKIITGFVNKMNTDSEYLESFTQGTGGIRRVRKRFQTTMSIIEEALS